MAARDTTFVCACGEVQIKFNGEPLLVNDCHCTDCVPIVQWLHDTKGGKGAELSPIINKTGVAKAFYLVKDMTFIKGKEKLKGFKAGPQGKNIRSYTSCCNTLCSADGGRDGGPGMNAFRPFNRIAIKYFDDMTPLKCGKVWATAAGNNPKWDEIPEPKAKGFPEELDAILGPIANASDEEKKAMKGELADDKTPGLYTPPEDVDEVCPKPP